MSVRPAHLGLRHLALQVTSFEAMKRFYVDLLGFRVEWEPDADNVYLTSGTDNLALHRSKGITKTENSALDHFGLVVRVPAEVDAWASFLERAGVSIIVPPRNHRDGARSCYFFDPDGNRIQIIYHPPISLT